jgi:hypothetical protein
MRTLAKLRETWRLKRRGSSQGGGFYVDLALSLPTEYEDAFTKEEMDATMTVDVQRDAANGEAYILTTRTTRHQRVSGVEAILEELSNMQRVVAWRTLLRCLELESPRAGRAEDDNDLAVIVVQSLVNAALARVTNTESPLPLPEVLTEEYKQGGMVQRGAFLDLIEAFTRAPGTQAAFEAEALSALVCLGETARTPALIRQTRGSKDAGLVNRLTAWVRQGALKSATR